MGFNDGSADRQANADSAGLGGVERLEYAFTVLRIDARSRIAYRDDDTIRLTLIGADQQLSCPRLDRRHCFDGIQY
jgi:hypothetical protein